MQVILFQLLFYIASCVVYYMLILKCSSRLSVVKEAEVDIGQLCMVGGTVNVLLGGLSLSEISHVDSSNNRFNKSSNSRRAAVCFMQGNLLPGE